MRKAKKEIEGGIAFDLDLEEKDFTNLLEGLPLEIPTSDDKSLPKTVSGEQLAKLFYSNYIDLAPKEKPVKPWEEVSESNRLHLIETCEKVLDKLFDENIDLNDELPDDYVMDLNPVKDFFDEYIGQLILGYEVFDEQLDDLEDQVSPSIIESTSIKGNALYIKLSKLDGKQKGYLKLEPTREGEFAQRFSEDHAIWASRYRILMYDGVVVEYLDSNNEGRALFVDNQKENT